MNADDCAKPMNASALAAAQLSLDVLKDVDKLHERAAWHYNQVVLPACYFSVTCFTAGALGESVLGASVSSALCFAAAVVLPPAAVSLFQSVRAKTTANALLRQLADSMK
jgi:hypothetical protein